MENKEVLDKKLNEALAIIHSASYEIKKLRRENEGLRARVSMFDDVMLLLRTNLNYGSVGMSPDLVSEMDKFVKDNNFI